MRELKKFLTNCIWNDKEPLLRVSIKLPDIDDEAFTREGSPVPKPIDGLALLDTGSEPSAIDSNIAKALGCVPVDIESIRGQSSLVECLVYFVSVAFPELSDIRLRLVRAVELPLSSLGIAFIIGRNELFNEDGKKGIANYQSVSESIPDACEK